MSVSAILAALKAAVLSIATSVGAAFASGLTTIGIGFLADERAIGVKVFQVFHDSYEAAKAAGKSELDAIEEAGTAAFNTFCHEEATEFVKEADALITLLVSSFKSAAGLKG